MAGGGAEIAGPVPRFPDFARVSLGFSAELRNLFNDLADRVSEFTFANLFAFRAAHDYRVSRLGSHLLITARGYDRIPYAFPPLGTGDPSPALEVLCRHLQDSGCEPLFFPVPVAWARDHLAPLDWTWEPDRDQADYVYRRADLAELAGKKYHRKRNRVLKLMRELREEVRFVDLEARHLPECLQLANAWCGIRCSAERPSTYAETVAVEEALLHCDALGLRGAVLLVGGRVEAFCLGEPLGRDTFVVHFEKAVPGKEGLAQMINQEFCRHALGEYEFVNREQDLGDPGLRQAKLSYHPEFLQEKVRARPR